MHANRLCTLIVSISFFILLCACQANADKDNENNSNTESQHNSDQEPLESDLHNENNSGQNDDSWNDPSNTENESEDEQNELENEDTENTTELDPTQEDSRQYRVNPTHYRIEAVAEETQDKPVLLTFDDGPTGEITYQILDILDQFEAQAIFFVTGYSARANTEALKEIHDRGHIIGNHSWTHANLREADEQTLQEEIIQLSDFIEQEIGYRPNYFRAPFGANPIDKTIFIEENMQYMNWSNGSLDWEFTDPQQITKQVLDNISSGDNILFHELEWTVQALDGILSELQEQGYSFVLPTEVLVPESE